MKEAIHIWLNHPSFNRDGDLELPRCWMAALKDTRSGPNQRPVAPTDSSSDSTRWDAQVQVFLLENTLLLTEQTAHNSKPAAKILYDLLISDTTDKLIYIHTYICTYVHMYVCTCGSRGQIAFANSEFNHSE